MTEPLPPVPADVPLSDAELATLRTTLDLAARNAGMEVGPDAVGLFRRLLREVERGRAGQAPVVVLGAGISLDRGQRALVGPDGTVVDLGPVRYAVADCLIRHRPGVATIGALAVAVWGDGAENLDRNTNAALLKCHVSNLRSILERLAPGAGKRLIATRLGYGYQLRPVPAATATNAAANGRVGRGNGVVGVEIR